MFNGIEALSPKMSVERNVCHAEDFYAWRDGQVIYLANENCFASYAIVPVSKEEEEDTDYEKLPIEKARYLFTRNFYNEVNDTDVSFESMSEEEVREFYIDHVLAKYCPVMFHEWLDAGNVCDIVDYTFAGEDRKYALFTCVIHNSKALERQIDNFEENKEIEYEQERGI